MKRIRIGYLPYSRDMSAASDRRRLVRYASLRGHELELFREGRRYDLIALGQLSDLPAWAARPRGGARLLFDLSDSYLDLDPWALRAMLRGTVKFVLRQHSHLELSFHRAIEKMCGRADAVVCSTPEQRQRILPHCGNVHAILDFQGSAAKVVKSSFEAHAPFRLFWEGQAPNVSTLGALRAALLRVGRERPLEIHVATDLRYRLWNGPGASKSTRELADRVLHGVRTYLYEWNESMFAEIATSCDLAVVPIPHLPMYWTKAENKLLLMWRMSVPTLVTATPAYVRTMKAAGLRDWCDSEEDWAHALVRMMADEGARARAATAGRTFVEREHGDAALLARWDALFASMGLQP
jgi:hypothetical protein